MENEQRKYWFFGSKLNSVLLLVLIILMVIAIRIMLLNKETYLPVIKKDYDETIMNVGFFQSLIKEGPESTIFECNLLGKKYFSFAFDKVENGSHVVGGGTILYTPDGTKIDSCPMNPTVKKSSLCKELEKPNASCKEVFVSNGFEGSVDIYHLKK